MKASLRVRLWTIAVSTALAFLVVIVTNMLVTRDVEGQLLRIQEQQIPKLELGPKLQGDFATLKRAYQDAVAAHDMELLERTNELRDRILADVDASRALLDPTVAKDFRAALVAYHEAAFDVSRRMMAGQGDEDAIASMSAMQAKQVQAHELLSRLVAFDQSDLKATFDGAIAAERAGARQQLIVLFMCLAVVLAVSLWIMRDVVRSLALLHDGFTRFGDGRFDEHIAVTGDDELAAVAKEANRMADSLAAGAAEREARDWIKSSLMELADRLRGDLDEEEVATRTVRTLARRIDAPAAALYRLDDRTLHLIGHHALAPGEESGDLVRLFTIGEGLVGEAARDAEIRVIEEVPAGFLRIRSGLGEAEPRCLVLVPLVQVGAVTGILELALFGELTAEARELLEAARESVAIALAVARSRAATQTLLARTQEQAERLREQEEELKSTNEELRCQQEELRQTNEELASQRGALEHRNAALQDVGRQLEKKAAELTTVSAYKSQFLANMSHELRTPLNSMLLLSKLLEDNAEGNLTSRQVEYARTVHSAGKDLLLLINQVLDLAKVEAGKQTLRVETVRIEDVVDRARRTFEPLAREKELELTIEIAPGLPDAIDTDGQRLAQILTNLLGNAIKFTEQGRVGLRIERPKARGKRGLPLSASVAFAVTDTGPGVPREHQARIFEPFEQLDGSAQRRQGGTGLGLGIAREFANLLGGELHLESTPGQGSTFTCVLPERADATMVSLAPPNAVTITTPEPEPPAEELDLLVIEDDATFAGVLGHIIAERGLSHAIASTGGAGLEIARARRPRGIILDVRLPDMDGWAVMEALRAEPATASIAVHFISGVEMADRGLALGAAGYLMKPAERPDLVRVVEELGRKPDRGAYKVLVIEPDKALGDKLVEQLVTSGLRATHAASTESALTILEEEEFACMIVDLAVPDAGELELLETLEKRSAGRNAEMPAVVIYTQRPLSRAEAARLESYAEAVVLKEGASTDRLLDEIRLFVRRLEAGAPRHRPAKVRDADVKLGGKKILVVDDDMRTVYALSAMLRARGADVLVAETGAVALDVLAAQPDVNAVLMDVMMPEMDGFEATRRIRAQPRFAALPIIALTAKAMKGDLERCMEAGATDYLPKPIDTDALLGVLHSRMSGAA
ncbi:MAG: response regulator [Labilithrix sp.]|nr:response regulator [Labilithrix sp.]MCW5816911.1 response regulator [Labilithrix sp.]